MDYTQLHAKLVEDFELTGLSEEEQGTMLFEIGKTIQKQFLLDVYELLGDEKFDALQASANMGEDFYGTTLKHLVPNYEELFQAAIKKVTENFKQGK